MSMNALAREPEHKARILIVEDDESLRVILRAVLEREGYEVESAGDGAEGLEAVDSVQPDLILLDMMMPRMDGKQLCRTLKSNARTSQIPIIMLTAMTEMDARIQVLDLGANDFLTKPYEQRELLSRVKNILAWGRQQRDANPLTGLPGNQGIDGQLARRLMGDRPFVFMYLDVDNFKAFNDFYSYQKGDQVIRMIAEIIRQVVEEYGEADDFIGHIGGDDFALVLGAPQARQIGEEILRRFDTEIPQLYSEQDRSRGYIQTLDRKGTLTTYPLMTLTIAAVASEIRPLEHVAQISDIASELKRFGKEQKKSVLIWDRRAD